MKFIIISLFISLSTWGSTIESTFQHVLNTNPQLKSNKQNIAITREQISRDWSRFKPSLDATYQYGRVQEQYGGSRGTFDINEFNVTLTQPIFQGLGDLYKLKESYRRKELTEANFANTQQDILLRAAIAHIRYATEKVVYHIAQKSEEAHRLQFYNIRTKTKLGAMTKVDLRLAQTRLATASADRVSAEAVLFQTQQSFIEIVGRDLSSIELPSLRKLPFASQKEFINEVLMKNPLMTEEKAKIDVSDLSLKGLKSAYFPSVNLEGQYTNDQTQSVFRSVDGRILTGSLNVTFPLYDGGARYADIRRARKVKLQAQHNYTAAKRSVVNLARTSWKNLSLADQLMELRERATSRAESTFRGFVEQHKAGVRDTQDLLNAQRELFSNQVREAQAKANLLINYYRALYLLGNIHKA